MRDTGTQRQRLAERQAALRGNVIAHSSIPGARLSLRSAGNE
jgi:hypothetical protein